MCIAFLTSDSTNGLDLVLTFNRDEYFKRPTQGFHTWPTHPEIYAPQDQQPLNPSHRGSWIGINLQQGRLAFLTNYREPKFHHDSMISRGALIRNFLINQPTTPANKLLVNGPRYAKEYAERVYEERQRYDGFNLVLVDIGKSPVEVYYVTNRGYEDNKGVVKKLDVKDILGVSNSAIDQPWKKVVCGKKEFARIVTNARDVETDQELVEKLMEMMRDRNCEYQVPERIDDLKNHIFIPVVDALGGDIGPGLYGTRSTAVILLRNGHLTVAEREYTASGQLGTDGSIPGAIIANVFSM
ncbi:Transport and Golgi organization protein 2 [Coemansia sp. RSA 1722]|nr:Transport and Golgi organization protein 2 [Coemansia sp. RSA 486]KAJ2238073.1 Transport and Golgi organization protein 2 [Coemansia sp. RSA 485]KAJ2603568.1 Transport and Golgi organization protein 2 [Coemansia sp. RSA 1721]KAJ2606170.1 Transport and Golgi organization protein 2 [Coemansia sp. RSA 1722]KAJ2639707.1 Transport and Golgi organization protein 2 [Coemansia sp. RSA 1286]